MAIAILEGTYNSVDGRNSPCSCFPQTRHNRELQGHFSRPENPPLKERKNKIPQRLKIRLGKTKDFNHECKINSLTILITTYLLDFKWLQATAIYSSNGPR